MIQVMMNLTDGIFEIKQGNDKISLFNSGFVDDGGHLYSVLKNTRERINIVKALFVISPKILLNLTINI